jgi:hypothetical protein
MLRWPTVALACAFAVAIAAAAFARQSTQISQENTPQATVRDFLTSAVVNTDGVTACSYLTERAQLSFEGREHKSGQTCQTFFGYARLTLGGLSVQSNAQLNELSYRQVPRGATWRITVSHRGQAISFVVRRADAADREEFMPPPTDWRIDSSVAALAPPTPNPARGL